MADFGPLSSLGIGSGVLKYDIIKQLKDVDKKAQIDPLDRKLKTNITEKKDLSALTMLIKKFKTSVSSLSDELTYLGRKVNTTGESASLSAKSGVLKQNISIDVANLASRDIYQSNNFKNDSSTLSGSGTNFKNGKITLNIDKQDYTIEIKESDTLKTLADKINESTEGKIQAKVLNVGGENPFQLILQSEKTGLDNKIEIKAFEDSSNPDIKAESEKILKALGWSEDQVTIKDKDGNDITVTEKEKNNITKAKDANFTFNGVNISRGENKIEDLQNGLTFNLLKEGKTSFNVVQDVDSIIENAKTLVSSYNELINNLNASTDYNQETGTAGVFQGKSEIVSIRSAINRILLHANENGESAVTEGSIISDIKGVKSEKSFGLHMSKDGLLKLDEGILRRRLRENPEKVEQIFRGSKTNEPIVLLGNKAVSAGKFDIKNGQIKIDDKSIVFKTDPANTTKQNAIALLEAINAAGIDGLKAKLSHNEDRIILEKKGGGTLEIDGEMSVLSSFGLSKGKTYSKAKTQAGVFADLNNTLDSFVNSNKGSLTLYDQRLTDQKKQVTKEKEKSLKQLEDKYNLMAKKFAAYDSMISKMNNQFAALKSMIDAQANGK